MVEHTTNQLYLATSKKAKVTSHIYYPSEGSDIMLNNSG